MRQLFLEGRALHVFPCRADKKPCTPSSFNNAVADAPSIAKLWARYPGPLVGVATGAVNGIDVIDIDPRNGGHRWLDANCDRLPVTRTNKTPGGGVHLIYKHRSGLRNIKIAPGVDLKTTGGYVIWHPLRNWPVLVLGPIAPFPSWVAVGGMGSAGTAKSNCNGSSADPIPPLEVLPTAYQINYANAAIRNACGELSSCQAGVRNTKLNVLAFNMGRLIARGWITRERVEHMLLMGAKHCGLLADDVLHQCKATIDSGIRAGMGRPYHSIGGGS